ncbi:hypothetical protein [Deinococcus sp.]|nr:hypothetical protein [Deinococcus sp.]
MTVKKLLTAILALALVVGNIAGASATSSKAGSVTTDRLPPYWGV